MNRQNERGPKAFFSVGLLILALVLAGMTAAEMIQIYRGDDQSAIQKKAVAKDLDQDNYEAKIEDAVKTGELTEEQADAKNKTWAKTWAKDMTGAKDKAGVKDKAGATDKGEDYYEAMAKRITEAVKSGELTEEQAQAKLAQIKKASGAKKIKSIK